MKIRTTFEYPPIPVRDFDWAAYDEETLDLGAKVGRGATEDEAIADLKEQLGQ